MKRWHRITMIALCGLWASTAVAQDGPAIDTSGGNLGGALSDGAGAEADAPADGAQQPALDTGSAGRYQRDRRHRVTDRPVHHPLALDLADPAAGPTGTLRRTPPRNRSTRSSSVRFVEYHEALTRHRAAQQGAADRTSQ